MLEEAGGGSLTSFWMDSIRSHCYATVYQVYQLFLSLAQRLLTDASFVHWQFETTNQAVACRNSIVDVVWPTQGGRRLSADFSSEEEAKAVASGIVPLASQKKEGKSRKQDAKAKAQGATRGDEQQGGSRSEAPKEKAKSLDDLFRSTKTEPRLYWLPADGSLAD